VFVYNVLYFWYCIIIIFIIISYLNTIVYSERMLSLRAAKQTVAVNVSYADVIYIHLFSQFRRLTFSTPSLPQCQDQHQELANDCYVILKM
jgi:hypothetical protein